MSFLVDVRAVIQQPGGGFDLSRRDGIWLGLRAIIPECGGCVMAELLRIRVGRVREYPGAGGVWTSAIGKEVVESAVAVCATGIVGDEQADPVNHGGVDKAVLCYAREHYLRWSAELGGDAPEEGTLGENFEVGEMEEDGVCVGDVFRVGGVTVQVSQPRQPCWKPAALHGMPQLTAQILKSGRTGWYLRVLEGGALAAPEAFVLLERPHPEWTVARATRVMHFEKDVGLRLELARVGALSAAWRESLG